MNTKGSLSEKSCDLIMALLKEPKIYDRVTMPANGKQRYTKVRIVAEEGLIQLGKYSWNSEFGRFWNNLIKCKKDISFEEFALRVWDALVDMTAGTNAHTPVLEGLGRETLMEGIRNKEWNWLVDRFFDICRHLSNEGYWKTQGTSNQETRKHHCHEVDEGVVITVQEKKPKILKVIDSVGDTFEILSARWVGGKHIERF